MPGVKLNVYKKKWSTREIFADYWILLPNHFVGNLRIELSGDVAFLQIDKIRLDRYLEDTPPDYYKAKEIIKNRLVQELQNIKDENTYILHIETQDIYKKRITKNNLLKVDDDINCVTTELSRDPDLDYEGTIILSEKDIIRYYEKYGPMMKIILFIIYILADEMKIKKKEKR